MNEIIHVDVTDPDIDLRKHEFDVRLVGKYGLELILPESADVRVSEDCIELPSPSQFGLDSGWTYRITAADSTQMTVDEAAFEYAAAFADLCEVLEHHPDTPREKLISWVADAYDLDLADETLDRNGITREDGFEPHSVRTNGGDDGE